VAPNEQLLREVVGTQYFAVLNTLGQGLPYSNLVSFATIEDLRSLVFATRRNTRKYRNMQENHNISLLIDNRANQPSDTSHAVAVTVVGTAREEIDDRSTFQAMLLARHPQLWDFVEAPDSAIMVVTVQEYVIAGFDKTQRVAMSQ
jgi:nitroimidazol reductase NimA-like FMN-containing flavoprotein (pyridoxamine 5'-phosphate oxidase superfamily)